MLEVADLTLNDKFHHSQVPEFFTWILKNNLFPYIPPTFLLHWYQFNPYEIVWFFCLIVSSSCNLSHFHLGCHKRFIGEREFEEWTNDSKASLGGGVIIIP